MFRKQARGITVVEYSAHLREAYCFVEREASCAAGLREIDIQLEVVIAAVDEIMVLDLIDFGAALRSHLITYKNQRNDDPCFPIEVPAEFDDGGIGFFLVELCFSHARGFALGGIYHLVFSGGFDSY